LSVQTARAGVLIRERHRIAIGRAVKAVESARTAVKRQPVEVEMVAEDLRVALRALDALIGRVDADAILGEIFASFCIGK
jgi:tRNA modification GTPase